MTNRDGVNVLRFTEYQAAVLMQNR